MALISTDVNNVKNDSRLIYFDYFRAFAILLIILGHCYNAWLRNQLWESALVNIISGNTALFVFISGFFFHHVYFPKYNYWTLVKTKTKFVFLPYLILSLLFITYYYFNSGEIVMTKYLNAYFNSQLNSLSLIIINLVTGRTMWAYWYIPFAMLIFLLSPVFIKFIHLKLATKIKITASLFILSIFVQRPFMEINPFHSLLYFAPYYLLGIIYSMERIKINTWIEGKVFPLLLVTILIAMTMCLLGQTDNAGKASILAWRGPDYMIFQKLSLIIFMLAFTMHLQKYDMRFLKTIANMSFALYFLHQWILSFMSNLGMLDFQHGFGGVVLIFIIVATFSYLLARVVKLLLGSISRYVIGW